MKNFINLLIAAILGSALTFGVFYAIENNKPIKVQNLEKSPYQLASNNAMGVDFTVAAEKVMEGVVHITSITSSQSRNYFNPFQYNDQSNKVGSGSGVIISEDGYIVTNNHVVNNADELEVTLHDNRVFKAKIVGKDPSTDLAVIKIDADDLKIIPFSNSDQTKVGEWVLAVGNPFNLTSTVTAGIISAKGRNIKILEDRSAIESFIQTDAAINPGNSGGALVNLDGGLVGINTAIASPTGSYTGYAFSIPSNLVKKVVEDLLEFGIVQRAYIGVVIRNVDAKIAKELNLNVNEGVIVDEMLDGGSAKEAGVEVGDVIVKIDDVTVKTAAELQEIIGRQRPGNKINVEVLRKGKKKYIPITLKNLNGNTEIVKKDDMSILSVLGIELEELSEEQLKKYRITSGIKVKSISAGKIKNNTNMEEGYVILKIDGTKVKTVQEVVDKLSNKTGGVLFEGIYPGYPNLYYYAVGL
jgi:Do/DeqQ family serine protease